MYVGIDVGGREGKNTEIALLQGEDPHPTLVAIHDVPPRGDDFIVNFLSERKDVIRAVGVDSPFDLPPCTRCKHKECSGLELCSSDEARMITNSGGNPYAERLTEIYVSESMEEVRPMQTMALGQIVARTMYLLKRLKSEGFPSSNIREVYPKASLFAFRRVLGMSPEDFNGAVKEYKTKDRGREARSSIIDSLSSIIDFSSFREECEECHDKLDAAIAGLSVFYSTRDLTLPRPDELPEEAGWIEIPDWKRIVVPFRIIRFGKRL
ncbi:MAG: DUF429 domain-containing protein [Thermoplasmata archaeon]